MTCDYCHEEILRGEQADCRPAALHVECAFRMGAGSVGHIRKQCSCYGGTLEDPANMTLRQAAKAAFDEWRKMARLSPTESN